MPRQRQRVRLESGLCLNLPALARQGTIAPGAKTIGRVIRWKWTAMDETVARGLVTADMEGSSRGWMKLELDGEDHWLELRARPRHFGGRQWYFHCERAGRDVSVMWKPNGARRFASRQAWGRQVAYGSQFETPHDRALTGAYRIRRRLEGGKSLSSADDPMPDKPKWMRWRTYERMTSKCEQYEEICDAHLAGIMGRLLSMG